MSNIILVIIGIALAAVAALMMIFYGGDVYTRYYNEAEAARLVSEGSQIESAVELYYAEQGRFPTGGNPVQTLIDSQYLAEAPKGNDDVPNTGQWVIDYDRGFIRSSVGSASNQASLDVCIAARRQLNFPEPENIYQCDGSDAPGGVLNGLDPCCLGNVND